VSLFSNIQNRVRPKGVKCKKKGGGCIVEDYEKSLIKIEEAGKQIENI
jgi:hypothetical protein